MVGKLSAIKGTKKSIAKGFATGVAMSFPPLFVGFHLLISLVISKAFKQNSMASAIGTIAGNPWTFPLIWYIVLHVGLYLLGQDAPEQEIDFKSLFKELFHCVINLDFQSFLRDIWSVFYPMLIGCIPIYIIIWGVTYHMVLRFLIARKETRNKDDNGIRM